MPPACSACGCGKALPYSQAEDPTVTHITVYPKERILRPQHQQQLVVTAHYTNGSTRDITHVAEYESNEKEMATVSERGLVTSLDQTGSTSVMVRFQEFVDVFQAIIPLGAEVANLPPSRNYIDELIFERLQLLGLPASETCDDATFIRRVTIDLAGRIPSPGETETFANDHDADKRIKLVRPPAQPYGLRGLLCQQVECHLAQQAQQGQLRARHLRLS